MIAVVALALVDTFLRFTLPGEFFEATNGTQVVMYTDVSSEYVHDDADPTNKVLRVMPQTAGYYYGLLSGCMERELLFGEARGVLDQEIYGMSKQTAFRMMRQGNLDLSLGAAQWLAIGTNRIVRGFGRFWEGDTTYNLTSKWYDDRTGRWAWHLPYGASVPRYFTNSFSAASVEFPQIGLSEPQQILSVVNKSLLDHTWVTWARLDDYPRAWANPISLPLSWLIDIMGRNCAYDSRPGSPASNFGCGGTVSAVGESLTNVIERLAPGCMANFTNATRRLDRRRLVAFARALSVDDRRFASEPFGDIRIEPGWNCTNLVEVTLSHNMYASVTNASLGVPRYNQDANRVKVSAVVSGDDMTVLTNTLTIVTNFTGVGAVATARRSKLMESMQHGGGGATFELSVAIDDFKTAATEGGSYHFGGIFIPEEYQDDVQVTMWHGSGPFPGSYDFVKLLPIENFVSSNIMIRASRWRGCDHTWSLDPRDLGDEARVPSPLTHDNEAQLPGYVWKYSNAFPKWMYANESLVSSIDLYSAGNVVLRWDVYEDPEYSMAEGSSEAWYYHFPHYGLTYTNVMEQVWTDVETIRQAVRREFTRKTKAPPGQMEEYSFPAASMGESLSGEWVGLGPGPVDVQPSELTYRGGEFYNDQSNVVRKLTAYFLAGPRGEGTNEVGRAISVSGNCGYLTGFNADFKNAVPVRR